MPTPYGSRGGMAFSADELRVLRAALAAVLQQDTCQQTGETPETGEAREYARLAAAMERAADERRRIRSYQHADLGRYRASLPGAALGYLRRLTDALAAGYLPRPDDLTALSTLPALAAGRAEAARRTALLRRCERLAQQSVRTRPLTPREIVRTGGGEGADAEGKKTEADAASPASAEAAPDRRAASGAPSRAAPQTAPRTASRTASRKDSPCPGTSAEPDGPATSADRPVTALPAPKAALARPEPSAVGALT